MSEGIHVPKREGGDESATGESGGLAPQAIPQQKRFFLVEYLDEVTRGLKWMRSAPKPEVSVASRVARAAKKWSKGRKARLGVVVVVIIMVAASTIFAAQASNTPASVPPGGGGGGGGGGNVGTYTNTSNVGQASEVTLAADFNSSGVFKSMTVVLTWTDEPGSVLQVNQPDSLGFDVVAPNGQNWSAGMATNAPGGSGRLPWALNDTTTNFGAAGWKIVVKGGNMGDYTRPSGRTCFTCPADNTNQFTVQVDYTF